MKLCFASNNKHKLEEVSLAIGSKFTILSLADINCFEELPETQDTLAGNSLQKAEFVFNHYHVPCFADDSGLEVEILNNEPGVYSARYAGDQRNDQDNIELLLANLQGQKNRKARFRSVITLIGLGTPHTFEGAVEGSILTAKIGSLGFGYDPVFQPVGYTQSFAEMSIEQKNKISHRAIAIQKLIAFLQTF